MALLKHANMNAARPADMAGGGRFQHELLAFQRAGTTGPQANTQLVSTMRPSVFIPDLQAPAACAQGASQGTTQKRSGSRKKDKSPSSPDTARPGTRRR